MGLEPCVQYKSPRYNRELVWTPHNTTYECSKCLFQIDFKKILTKIFVFFWLKQNVDVESTREVELRSIQTSEGTKDVPSGKGGWHRPVALEYVLLWNMLCRYPPNLTSRE